MRCRPLLAALALAILPLTAPAAARGAAWLEPVGLSEALSAAPQVDTGVAGDAAAIWSIDSTIQARLRAPGGPFGEVQQLSTNGSSPDVAVAGDGTAVAAWLEGEKVRFTVRAPGAGFGPVQDVPADGTNGTPSLLQLAVNDAGEAILVYQRGGPFAAIRPAGGTFSAPVALAANGCNPRGAIGPAGHAAVVWQANCAASEIRVARRAPGAAFGPGTGLGELGSAPAVTVEANGATTVAYERTAAIRAASAPADAGFGGAITISSETPTAEPALASGGGEVWAVWRAAPGGVNRVAAARRPAGGAFAPVANPSPDGIAAGRPRLQGAETGAMLAAWQRQVGDNLHVETAWREPGAPAFGTATLVSAAGSAVLGDVGGDGDGNAATGYLLAGKPVARVLDGAGPRLLNLDVRTAGFAKESYAFSFAPSDAWSAVTASAFDFGDGTTAAGPTATHAYPEPAGPRTITLLATDATGNTSRLQRPFQVAPAIDRTPPVISAVRLDARRFRLSTKPTPAYIAATRRRGTRFRYTLSEPAAVTIQFERLLPGRRKGSRCVRGRSKGKRCKISQPAGSIVRVHPVAGPVSVGFTGRVTAMVGPLRVYDNTLLPGSYRATFTAIDQLRNRSQAVKAAFTIVSR